MFTASTSKICVYCYYCQYMCIMRVLLVYVATAITTAGCPNKVSLF